MQCLPRPKGICPLQYRLQGAGFYVGSQRLNYTTIAPRRRGWELGAIIWGAAGLSHMLGNQLSTCRAAPYQCAELSSQLISVVSLG